MSPYQRIMAEYALSLDFNPDQHLIEDEITFLEIIELCDLFAPTATGIRGR